VIGVDGGARAAAPLGLTLHLIVGDFDTLRAEEVDAFAAQGVRVARSPHDKDATDTELALLAACDEGASRVEILGALGLLAYWGWRAAMRQWNMPMMVLDVRMRFGFDRKVDFYLPFLASVLNMANATIRVTITPMMPLSPTLSRSFSRPVMP